MFTCLGCQEENLGSIFTVRLLGWPERQRAGGGGPVPSFPPGAVLLVQCSPKSPCWCFISLASNFGFQLLGDERNIPAESFLELLTSKHTSHPAMAALSSGMRGLSLVGKGGGCRIIIAVGTDSSSCYGHILFCHRGGFSLCLSPGM